MSEQAEGREEQDPAPLKNADAERVSGEQAGEQSEAADAASRDEQEEEQES